MELTISVSLVCLTLVFTAFIYFKIKTYEVAKTYDANVQGFLLTKSDRINGRLEKWRITTKKQNSTIDIKDFNECIKSIQIMIAQELTYKKYREEGKQCK